MDKEALDKYAEENGFIAWFAKCVLTAFLVHPKHSRCSTKTVQVSKLRCQQHQYWYPLPNHDRVLDNLHLYADEAMKFLIEKVLEVAKTNQVPSPQQDTIDLETESKFLSGEVHHCCCDLVPVRPC